MCGVAPSGCSVEQGLDVGKINEAQGLLAAQPPVEVEVCKQRCVCHG
nr:hypothetical protein [Sinorhizobium meliloti]